MIDGISLVLGMLIASILIMFIGHLDFNVLDDKSEIKTRSKVRIYIYATAWEFAFFSLGYLVRYIQNV